MKGKYNIMHNFNYLCEQKNNEILIHISIKLLSS